MQWEFASLWKAYAKIQYIITAENHEGFYRKKSFLFAFQEKKKEPPKKAPICPLGSGWGWKQPAKIKIKTLLYWELQNSDLPSLRKYHKDLLESGDLV